MMSFTVTDPSGVARVGNIYTIGPCRPAVTERPLRVSTTTVTVDVTFKMMCNGTHDSMYVVLSSATDNLGNTTRNAPLGGIISAVR